MKLIQLGLLSQHLTRNSSHWSAKKLIYLPSDRQLIPTVIYTANIDKWPRVLTAHKLRPLDSFIPQQGTLNDTSLDISRDLSDSLTISLDKSL